MKKEYALVLSAVLFFGCSSAPDVEIPEHSRGLENLTVYDPDTEPAMNIEFIREVSFGNTDETPFSIMQAVSIDDNGKVYIADGMQNHIIVFNPDGSYHSTVGRRGSGPGEFLNILVMKLRSGQLHVYDPIQQWINIFTLPSEVDSTAAFSHTVNFVGESWEQVVEPGYNRPQIQTIRSDGSMLLYSSATPAVYGDSPETDGSIRYHVLDSNTGSLSEVIFEQPMAKEISGTNERGGYRLSPPFYASADMVLLANDHIVSAWSEDFLIRVHDPDGTYLHGFYYPIEKLILEREDAVNLYSNYQQVFRTIDLPETWPVIVSMISDDENRIWVEIRTESEETNEWWILDPNGELQAKFNWSSVFTISSIREVKDNYLYAMETNEESGLREVVRYRIEMEEAD